MNSPFFFSDEVKLLTFSAGNKPLHKTNTIKGGNPDSNGFGARLLRTRLSLYIQGFYPVGGCCLLQCICLYLHSSKVCLGTSVHVYTVLLKHLVSSKLKQEGPLSPLTNTRVKT